MYCVTVPLLDRPGAIADVMDHLAQQTLPVTAFMIGRGLLHIATPDGAACRKALVSGGFDALSAPMIRLELPDEPGLLAKVFGALADAFVNVLVSFGIGTGQQGTMYIQVNDPQRAMPVLHQFGIAHTA